MKNSTVITENVKREGHNLGGIISLAGIGIYLTISAQEAMCQHGLAEAIKKRETKDFYQEDKIHREGYDQISNKMLTAVKAILEKEGYSFPSDTESYVRCNPKKFAVLCNCYQAILCKDPLGNMFIIAISSGVRDNSNPLPPGMIEVSFHNACKKE